MRSWEARGDTYACDEPLYAHYLQATGTQHPSREIIIETYETDWRQVVDRLTGPVPNGKPIHYQKHMAHHILPDMMGPWLRRLTHGFLIRDPEEMLLSLARVMPEPTVDDTGLPQQCSLFEYVRDDTGDSPPVVDARDVLSHPEVILRKLCEAFGLSFSEKMLSWESGPRKSDGIWARHWYASVLSSTGFRPYQPPEEKLPERLAELHDVCRPYYDALFRHRLTP